MKSFACSARINASAEVVWALLTDAPSYAAWNPTVSRVDGQIAPGEQITVHAKINPGHAFPVSVSEFAPPARMVWSGGMPWGLFKGERVFTITREGAGVVFAMREEFTGFLAPLIGRSIPDLQPAFDEFAAALKAHAERPR